MSTLSVRMSDDELKLIRTYATVNNMSVSALLRNSVLDKIEDDLLLDEERILRARNKARKEKKYPQEEVWEMLGI